MQGELDLLVKDKGYGVPIVEVATGRELLGTSPGAQSRVSMSLQIPPVEGELVAALLTLGIEATPSIRTPIRMRVTLDRGSVTREFKPQFRVELDDTIYYKAVYNVKPILVKRVGRGIFHTLTIIYDLVQPVFFRDASLVAIFSNTISEYALSFLTGAKVLEPGEVTVEYPPFFNSFGGTRRAGLIIHSPYHESEFSVTVAGAEHDGIVGQGSFHITIPFSYPGSLVPVGIRYREPDHQFYPKRAVVTDVYLVETRKPRPRLGVYIRQVEHSEGKLRVKLVIENTGEASVSRISIVMIALGSRIAYKRLRSLDPGSRIEVHLEANLERLPIKPSRVQINVSGYSLGDRIEEFLDINL